MSTPTSATGRWTEPAAGGRPRFGPRRPGRGFTLIEVLVVVFILGIALSAVGLAVGDGGRRNRLESSAEHMRAVLALAAQEALLRGAWLGASFDRQGYRVLWLKDGEWQPPEQGGPLGGRRLPEGVGVRLRVDGEPVTLPPPGLPGQTQVLFTPEGEVSRFEILLDDRRLGEGWRLQADALGRVSLERRRGPS